MAGDTPEKGAPTDRPDDEESNSLLEGYWRRRSVLLGTAAAVGAGGLSTVTGGQSDSVDIVEYGADPTGNEPVNDYLTSALDEYGAVTFPPGDYRVSGDLEISGDGWTVTGVNSTLLFPDGGLDLSGSGWTFDGFEIDFRQQDGFDVCWLGDSNWTFGNVVFRGTRQIDTKSTLLVPTVSSGSSAQMHDVYVHEGNANGDEDGKPKLMWQDSDMSGTLHITRMWAEHWAENTIYASDMDGSLIVRDSYFRNTNTGCIRGSEHIEAHGCTFVADGPIPGQWNEERRGSTEFKGMWCNFDRGSGDGVGVVSDCDFYYTHESGVGSGVELDGPGDSITVENSRFHSTFSVPMVDGPGADMSKRGSGNVVSGGFRANVSSIDANTSSEPATDGSPPLPEPPELGKTPNGRDQSSTPGGGSGEWSTLRIEGDGDPSTGAEFTFTVSGDLQHLTPADPVLQPDHGVDGSTATEDVWSEDEEYRFTGDVTVFELDGPATIYLDGTQTSIASILQGTETPTETETETETSTPTETETPTETPTETETETPTETPPDDGTDDDHRLEIVAEDHVEYRFTASDEIEMVLDDGDSSAEDGNDAVAENDDGTWTAEGLTGNGYGDTYDFTGDVTEFETLVGECTLYLEGEEVTVEELLGDEEDEEEDDAPSTDHRLEIVAEDPLDYVFSASGGIEMVLENGDNSAEDGNDDVAENDDGTWTAEGHTGNGYGDTYDFAGEVTDFEPREGQFSLHLDGEEVTVEELLGEDSSPPDDETLPNTIVISASEDSSGEYSFAVTGALEKHESRGTRDDEDTIDGSSASGVIDPDDVDAYRFEGSLRSLNLTGSAEISLDH